MNQITQLRMETQRPNVFIVIDNDLTLKEFSKHISENFGQRMNILSFKTMNETLTHLDENPDFVVLDNALKDENISEFQMRVKNNNPQVKVLMLTSNQEVGIALNEFFNQPINSIVNDKKLMKKIPSMVYRAAVFPIYLLTREFRINKFVAIFILTFVTVGIVSLLGYFLFVHNA